MRAWIVFLLTVVLAAGTTDARAQQAQERPTRPKIQTLYGPLSVQVGETANYRVRLNRAAERPVLYYWSFGDGIASEGSLVAHRYSAPGAYLLEVVAVNERGRDTLQATVEVTPAPPPDPSRVTEAPEPSQPAASRPEPSRPEPTVEPPVRSRPEPRSERRSAPEEAESRVAKRAEVFGKAPILPSTTGYAWQVRADFLQERLFDRLVEYRLSGYRVGILTDSTGRGSRVYRLLVGKFETPESALAARSDLPEDVEIAQLYTFRPPPTTLPEPVVVDRSAVERQEEAETSTVQDVADAVRTWADQLGGGEEEEATGEEDAPDRTPDPTSDPSPEDAFAVSTETEAQTPERSAPAPTPEDVRTDAAEETPAKGTPTAEEIPTAEETPAEETIAAERPSRETAPTGPSPSEASGSPAESTPATASEREPSALESIDFTALRRSAERAAMEQTPVWVWMSVGALGMLLLLWGGTVVYFRWQARGEMPEWWRRAEDLPASWLDAAAAEGDATDGRVQVPPADFVDEDFDVIWPDEEDEDLLAFPPRDDAAGG